MPEEYRPLTHEELVAPAGGGLPEGAARSCRSAPRCRSSTRTSPYRSTPPSRPTSCRTTRRRSPGRFSRTRSTRGPDRQSGGGAALRGRLSSGQATTRGRRMRNRGDMPAEEQETVVLPLASETEATQVLRPEDAPVGRDREAADGGGGASTVVLERGPEEA